MARVLESLIFTYNIHYSLSYKSKATFSTSWPQRLVQHRHDLRQIGRAAPSPGRPATPDLPVIRSSAVSFRVSLVFPQHPVNPVHPVNSPGLPNPKSKKLNPQCSMNLRVFRISAVPFHDATPPAAQNEPLNRNERRKIPSPSLSVSSVCSVVSHAVLPPCHSES